MGGEPFNFTVPLSFLRPEDGGRGRGRACAEAGKPHLGFIDARPASRTNEAGTKGIAKKHRER
jgi:hypothetical protein